MNSTPHVALHPWTKELEASRDVHPRQRDGFTMVLGWFETFRSRSRLAPGREACVRFWTEQAKVKERPAWQLEQWAAAIEWYLRWVKNSRERGDDTRTLEERVRGRRGPRGLAARLGKADPGNLQSMGGRFAIYAGDDREVLQRRLRIVD